jgi:hypothetical protein
MRRMALLLTVMTVTLVLASGIALAAARATTRSVAVRGTTSPTAAPEMISSQAAKVPTGCTGEKATI